MKLIVAMYSKEFWLVQENHATVKADSSVLEHHSSWNENLQQKQNWAAKSTILKKFLEKSIHFFVIRAALWAEKLERCLKIAEVEKIPSKNLRLRST